jgi:hypothetical protein
MQSPNMTLLALSLNSNDVAFNLYIHPCRDNRRQSPFRSFQADLLGFNRDLDTDRYRYRQLSNA